MKDGRLPFNDGFEMQNLPIDVWQKVALYGKLL